MAYAQKTPAKPYGDVEYADPGYQADGQHRYPLSDEAKCRAAWSYINMPRNAAKYSPEDLAKVKAKIRAAGQRYGVEFADPVAASAALSGVELARPGTWHLSSGKRTFTPQNLKDAADFYAAAGGRKIPLGFGHTDPRFDGEPAYGWVDNIRYAEDDKGPVLLGDLVDMDEWLAAAAPKRWPNRSIEGFAGLDYNGRRYSLALTRLALLGATPPAMPVLRSLADMKAKVTASAEDYDTTGAEWIAASLALSEEDTQTPAAEADAPPTRKKEPGMDPALIREAVDLPEDASDDEVRSALVSAGLIAPPDPTAAPIMAAAPGTIVLASSVWEDTQKTIRDLSKFVEQSKRNERDVVLASAVKAGKFLPAQLKQFTDMWDSNPDVCRSLVEAMTPNSAFAVAASGYAGESVGDDAEYAALFGGNDGKAG